MNTELNNAELNQIFNNTVSKDQISEEGKTQVKTYIKPLIEALISYTDQQLYNILINLNSSFGMTKSERNTFTKAEYVKVIIGELVKLGCEDAEEANDWIKAIVEGESWVWEREEAIKLNTNFVETPEAKKENEPVKLKTFIVNPPEAQNNKPTTINDKMNATTLTSSINKEGTVKTTVITTNDNFELAINLSALSIMVNVFYNDDTICYFEMFLDRYPAETKPLALRLKHFENEDDFIANPVQYALVFQSCIHCLMYMVWYGDYHRRANFIIKKIIKQWEEMVMPREQYDTNHRNLMECSALLDTIALDMGTQLRGIGYEPTQMKSGETLSKADFAWFSRRNDDKQFVSFEMEMKAPKVILQKDGRKGLLLDFKANYHNKKQPAELAVCCLCSKPYTGYGNNAQPLSDGRCCDDCNRSKVVPLRFLDVSVESTFAQASRLAQKVSKAKSKEEEKAELEATQAKAEEERQRKQAEKEEREKRQQAEKERLQYLKKIQKQEEERLVREAKAEKKAEKKRKEDYLKAIGEYKSPEQLRKERERRLKDQVAEMTKKRR
jgi:hypothetical protein